MLSRRVLLVLSPVVLSLVGFAGCGGDDARVRAESTESSETDEAAAAPAPEPEPQVSATPPAMAHEPGPAEEPPIFLGSHLSQARTLELMASARPRQFKPVGTTSVVFRVRLADDLTIAYKPRSRMHRYGWRSEIAAYRVSRLLGMDNVPPVISRRFRRGVMRTRLHRGFTESWEEINRWTLWNGQAETLGAAIYWIPEMEELGLERRRLVQQWRGWLAQEGEVPDDKGELASDLSTLLVFDYLIGNWDRFSGANLQGLPSGRRIFARDHNVAFATPLPPHLHDRLREQLVTVERFSRHTITALARIDRAALVAELAEDPAHAQIELLDEAQLADLLDRRATVLSHVSALIDQYGIAAVLAFP